VLGTPEGRAWAILLTAFTVFCVLIVSIPLGIRWHIRNATVVQESILEDPIDGAVYVQEPLGTALIAFTQRNEQIPEGATIATDEHLRAFLRLFDGSTLTLYNNTRLILERTRKPRYAASPRANQIRIRVERGRVAVGVAAPLERALQMEIVTPHGNIQLQEGSFWVVVDPEETQLTIRPIRPGEATVRAGNEIRRFTTGRCRIVAGLGGSGGPAGSAIEGPLPPETDMIVNGDFAAMLDRGWEAQERQRQDENDPLGEIGTAPLGGKTVLAFQRDGAGTHGETSITQYIDKDIRDFASLRLTCEVLVNYQSLPGGGYRSTEFPVMIELSYRDSTDAPRSLYWGFYYLDPGTGPEWWPLVNGLKVVQGEWYAFETENLMQTLADARPVHIESVRVYASGWDWDSAITNISLLVQE
jgi:hypothetical protein